MNPFGYNLKSVCRNKPIFNRSVSRNSDAFGYNERSEITGAIVPNIAAEYGYDEIGNSTSFTANSLNQYSQFQYDSDGNLLSDGVYVFVYDSQNRLKTVSSNGVLLVTNYYDAKSRRIRKVTLEATTTFFYDDWNLIEERIVYTNGTASTIKYYWGKDLSGSLQGAGGVGGLLYLTVDGIIYIPCYDNNGNITKYIDANGNTVARYTYDAFGNLISKSGSLADFFRHRFSTKYFDAETELYYYGYRFYHPTLMRWLNRDPIEEEGGQNLYGFCKNNPLIRFDPIGNTSVEINIGIEANDSYDGFADFIKIEAAVIEPPAKNGKLNFIQLKKNINSNWKLDIQGTLGPYYYTIFDIKKYSRKDKQGRDVIIFYDAPRKLIDKVDFYTAVVEVNRTCRYEKFQYGISMIKCYDRVKVVTSVSWSFDPNHFFGYLYSGKTDTISKSKAMIPTLQQLINNATWKTELCPLTQVEILNAD